MATDRHEIPPSLPSSVVCHVPSNRCAELDSDDASALWDLAGFDFGCVDLAGAGVGLSATS